MRVTKFDPALQSKVFSVSKRERDGRKKSLTEEQDRWRSTGGEETGYGKEVTLTEEQDRWRSTAGKEGGDVRSR